MISKVESHLKKYSKDCFIDIHQDEIEALKKSLEMLLILQLFLHWQMLVSEFEMKTAFGYLDIVRYGTTLQIIYNFQDRLLKNVREIFGYRK